jgi:DNA-binding NarL/FixJ family response regulator
VTDGGVLLAEDNLLLREGVLRVLASQGIPVVGVVDDARLVIDACQRLRPAVIVADVRMPPTMTDDGLRAALSARSADPALGVLVLSQYLEDAYVADLTAAGTGGVGYLLKERVSDVAEFADAVRRVGAGGTAFDKDVIGHLIAHRRSSTAMMRLTKRETEVLALMAEGLANPAIARRLFISGPAVEKHVRSIFQKLGLQPGDNMHRRVLAVLHYLRRGV